MTTDTDIVITAAKRTPIGNFNGYYSETPTTRLGAYALSAVIKQSQLDAKHIDEIIMGCVLPAGLGQAPARQAAVAADIPFSTSAVTLNKVCGSSLKSVMMAHDEIKAGSFQCVIAGGMENMSQTPYLLQNARFGYRLGDNKILDHMMLDGLIDPYDGQAMGLYGEQCATKYGFTREQQDAFAAESVRRAQEAVKSGAFNDEITAVDIVNKKQTTTVSDDEGPLTIDANKISQLRPAFKKDGTITAANASSISDGAAALLVMSAQRANELKTTPVARVIGHYTHAQEPAWFTTAPIAAIQGLLKKVGWQKEDVDLFEINEAFAVVTMAAMTELDLPHDKVNVNGGACVLGHPIGATGARILVTLINALRFYGKKRGIATACIGGGEATAIAIEVLDRHTSGSR